MGRVCVALVLGVIAGAACSGQRGAPKPANPLVAAKTTMVTAWDIPLNPLKDPTLGTSQVDEQIRWGYRIFTNTPVEAARFTGGKVSCANCHLNAGQRERALPLVSVAGMFPEWNNRAARLISLQDRIVDCFLRSENATGRLESDGGESPAASDALPATSSKEVLAVSAYITWLAKGSPVATNPTWRGQNAIAKEHLIPIDKLDRTRGEALFVERCASCHLEDGQGKPIGGPVPNSEKRAGPLWGPDSWNDGAGAARVYTLAGIIRYTMPYLDPGSLTDEDAQHLSAFINAQPRPEYPYKARDYPGSKVPADAVYYRLKP